MSIGDRAKEIYESRLKAELEANHRDRFVAIEPESESFYLGDNFVEAALAAKAAHPDRLPFVIRIGHPAAIHLGGVSL